MHCKRFRAKKNNMIYVNSDYQLRMYSGPFELDDFAKLVLDCGKQERNALPGATKMCYTTHGRVDELNGLPGAIPLEVGYGCFGCKAGLQLSR